MDSVEDPRNAPVLRWGILGPGWIADKFVAALRAETMQAVVAVGSRSETRAADFAQKWDVPAVYTSYEDLVAADDVDVIYVATPHSHHAEHALLAINAGKHVLVEKSFTRNAAEARQVVAAARDRGVFCMEAMWTRFLPHMVAARSLIADGELGSVISLQADHGQQFAFYPEHRLFNPDLAGGALLDLGIYPVSLAHYFLGLPTSFEAVARKTSTGVDGHVGLLFDYECGAIAEVSTTLWAHTANAARITGTRGRVEIAGSAYQPSSFIFTRDDGSVVTFNKPLNHGLHFQAVEVARRVSAGELESPLMPLDDSIAIMDLLDDIRRVIGVDYPGE